MGDPASTCCAMASASIQSALTSTGLPARGVTGRPSMRASIQVSAQPSAPWRSSPSGGSTPMPNRVPAMWCSTIAWRTGASSTPRSSSPVTATWRPTACDEPERAVRGVVLEGARVRRVREHPLGHGGGRTAEARTALVPPVGGQEQALVGGHQVARPLAEPGVARDGGRAAGALDHELVRGEDELPVR